MSLPKHVFANPECPEICPILWLGIYILCIGFEPRIPNVSPRLFHGENDNTESRFSTWLRVICNAHVRELYELGVLIVMIGTHSFRKGVATFLSNIPGGPTAVAIFLRAGSQVI